MARVIVLDSFGDALENVTSTRACNVTLDAIKLLEQSLEHGSADLPPMIRRRFPRARTLAAPPLDIIYQYDTHADTVVVVGLIHQRAMR